MAGNTKKKDNKIPKTAQESIPLRALYENGVAESKNGRYSITYELSDINYRTVDDQDQEDIFDRICRMISALSDTNIQFSCLNRKLSEDDFSEKHLLPFTNDKYNKYREETNKILLDHLREGNKIHTDKYITVSIEGTNADDASDKLNRIGETITSNLHSIGCTAVPLDFTERLKLFCRVYQPENLSVPDYKIEDMKMQKMTSRDAIAPSYLKFLSNSIDIEENKACIMYISSFPSTLSSEFIAEINEMPCCLLSSVHFEAIQQSAATTLVRNQLVNINSNIQQQQRRASNKGYSTALISPDLEAAREEALQLLDDLTKKDQRLYMTTFSLLLYAKDDEELKTLVENVEIIGRSHMCVMRKIGYQQEVGMNSVLPLADNELPTSRMLTTETAALFAPFSAVEYNHNGGLYYGLNAITHSMILFSRLKSKNANGFILGTPGSGKSFSAKREMTSVLLGSDADVYVIDPEGEYSALANLFGGEVIRIAPGSNVYINPLDMDMSYADEDDPVTLKADYLSSICETAVGGKYGLAPIEKAIIDRCCRSIYQPYLSYMSEHPELTSDNTKVPTLKDFYTSLLSQPEPEAHNLAIALELYCIGSLNVFSEHTNVNTNSRFVVYNIKDIGSGLKELGLKVCLNDIWNKTIANGQKKKRTWFYIDEFYLLTQTSTSASFLREIYKRARKWGGVPTGLTQNVGDLLANEEAVSIFNNCDFIMMLNQSPIDRAELSNLLHISEHMQQYITNVDHGHGLLYTGTSLVPFVDNFPKDTELFKVMTTQLES